MTFKVRVLLPWTDEKESNAVEATWEDKIGEIDAAREKTLGEDVAKTLAHLRDLGAIDYNTSATPRVVILEDAKSSHGTYAKAGTKLRESYVHFL